MNIFILDKTPELCARAHCDRHVVSQIKESVQMLSTTAGQGYKPAHINHPCTQWAGRSIKNWMWLRDLAYALHDEWKFRYNHPVDKVHKSIEVLNNIDIPNLPDVPLDTFTIGFGSVREDLKLDDAIDRYRRYYNTEKAHIAKWTRREIPEWVRRKD